MVVLDWAEHKGGDLNQTVTIPPSAFAGTLENNIGFEPGDEIALRELLYAALVQSDNVSAYTLASYVGSIIQGPTPPEVPAVPLERRHLTTSPLDKPSVLRAPPDQRGAGRYPRRNAV